MRNFLIGCFVCCVLSNFVTWHDAYNAGYLAAEHTIDMRIGLLTAPPVLSVTPGNTVMERKPISYASNVTMPLSINNEPVIIGPSPKDTPAVALYQHDKFIRECFAFGTDNVLVMTPFRGFLTNVGTVVPTTEWAKEFCK